MQEIDGGAVFFVHHGHEHIQRAHLPFFNGLGVDDGALHDALEAKGGLGVGFVEQAFGQGGGVVAYAGGKLAGQDVQIYVQGFERLVGIGATGFAGKRGRAWCAWRLAGCPNSRCRPCRQWRRTAVFVPKYQSPAPAIG